jgi:DNA replication protein DnaC
VGYNRNSWLDSGGALQQELSYADFLDQLLACEVDAKTLKHHQMRIAMARFPCQKTLESFDSVQLSIM